jgi:hypothetical protein
MSNTTQQQPPQPQVVYVQKKRSILKTFLIIGSIFAVLMVAGIAGCTALVGSAANSIDKSIKKEQALDKPYEVNEGAAFEHDGYKVAAGWKIVKEPYGGATIKGLTVTNVSHEQSIEGEDDTPMFTFTLWNGQQNMTEIEADGNAIAQGQTSKMDAISLDTNVKGVPAHDRVTVKDMW